MALPKFKFIIFLILYLGPVVQSGNYTMLLIIRVPDGRVLVSADPLQQGKFYENRPFFIEG